MTKSDKIKLAAWRWRRGVCWATRDNFGRGRREVCYQGQQGWLAADVIDEVARYEGGVLPFGVLAGRNAVSGWVAQKEFGRWAARSKRDTALGEMQKRKRVTSDE